MSQSTSTLTAHVLWRENFARHADWLAVGVAVALPWSTSATLALLVLWLPMLLAAIPAAELRRSFTTATGALPVVLWALAGLGMIWATAPMAERLDGFNAFHKLLALPLLLAQFRRSERGHYVLIGFLASCTVLLLLSWALILLPGLSWRGRVRRGLPMLGIPVKDLISQSMVFTLCIFGLMERALVALKEARRALALALAVLALAFLANILYVATSRTALVAIPVLLLLLAAVRLGARGTAIMLTAFALVAAAAWPSSSFLRQRVTTLVTEIRDYRPDAMTTSAGERMDFWRNAATFIGEAPLIGHGTGAIREQFRRTGGGRIAEATNPHNQTIAIALQLGLVGVAALLAMWGAHLLLFWRALRASSGVGKPQPNRAPEFGALACGIGLALVGQNMISSLFNSSLSDLTHGWTYVLGVGVLGGMTLRARESADGGARAAEPTEGATGA
jgi:O-antigen ligase